MVHCRALVANESQAVGARGEATRAFHRPMTRAHKRGLLLTKTHKYKTVSTHHGSLENMLIYCNCY